MRPKHDPNKAVQLPDWASWVFMLVFVLAFGGAGVWIVAAQLRDIASGIGSQSWPTARATVTESSWITYHQGSVVGQNRQVAGRGYTHAPRVMYTFTVGNAVYTGSRIRFGEYRDGNLRAVVRIAERYPVGRVVLAAYHPSNPSQSVLEHGLQSGNLIFVAVGLVFLGIGAFFGRVGLLMLHNPGSSLPLTTRIKSARSRIR